MRDHPIFDTLYSEHPYGYPIRIALGDADPNDISASTGALWFVPEPDFNTILTTSNDSNHAKRYPHHIYDPDTHEYLGTVTHTDYGHFTDTNGHLDVYLDTRRSSLESERHRHDRGADKWFG